VGTKKSHEGIAEKNKHNSREENVKSKKQLGKEVNGKVA
jgi:hypothetical protein